MKIATPLEKSHPPPSFPATPSKVWGPVKPPLFENLVWGSNCPPPPSRKGGVPSMFPCTARIWNSLPTECIPLTYNVNTCKSRINKHLDDMIYSSWDIEYDRLKLVIMEFFLPFYPLAQNFVKNIAGDIILHLCTKNHNHMRYGSWDMEWDWHSGTFFALLPI